MVVVLTLLWLVVVAVAVAIVVRLLVDQVLLRRVQAQTTIHLVYLRRHKECNGGQRGLQPDTLAQALSTLCNNTAAVSTHTHTHLPLVHEGAQAAEVELRTRQDVGHLEAGRERGGGTWSWRAVERHACVRAKEGCRAGK